MSIFSIKEAFKHLVLLAPQLPNIRKDHPQYEDLINAVLKAQKGGIPNLQTVQEETTLSNSKLRKQIKELYFLLLSEDIDLNFDKVEYNLHFKVSQDYAVERHYQKIRLNQLAALPRIGDYYEAYFLGSAMGINTFYVSRIQHSLDGNKQVVDIILGTEKPGLI